MTWADVRELSVKSVQSVHLVARATGRSSPSSSTRAATADRNRTRRRFEASNVAPVTVDLAGLPVPLADAVRAARRRRSGFVAKPLLSKRPDPLIGAWVRDIIDSGDLDAEIATADPPAFVIVVDDRLLALLRERSVQSVESAYFADWSTERGQMSRSNRRPSSNTVG